MSYSQYDKIASEYDSLFVDENSLIENLEVGAFVLPLTGSFLDVGCGTGLLLEIKPISPLKYKGIDPSEGMLNVLKSKFPYYKVEQTKFEDVQDCLKDYDNIVSLFGSISYVSPDALKSIHESGKKYFLMFYKTTYHPVTYEKTKVEFQHYCMTRFELAEIFKGAEISIYKNYFIVKNF